MDFANTEYVPAPLKRTLITKTINYVPSRRGDDSSSSTNNASFDVETMWVGYIFRYLLLSHVHTSHKKQLIVSSA